MRKNRTIIIIIILLIAAAFFLLNNNTYSTLQDDETAFNVEDTASVTKIFIADKGVNQVLLQRENGEWYVDGKIRASQRAVEIILETLYKLRVKAPVSLASQDNVVRRMSAVSRKVEVYQMVYRINIFDKIRLFKHEKLTKVFYIGDATQDNLGTYMLMDGAEQPYIVYIPSFRGFLSPRFTPLPDDWKSHIIFDSKLADIKSVEVVFDREPENSFRVSASDGLGNYDIIALQENRKLDDYDTLKLLNLLTSFRDLRYESRLNNILTPMRIDSIVNSPALYELTLVEADDDTVYVKMFEKRQASEEETGIHTSLIPVDHDRVYGLVNDGEDFVLLQYYSFDKVLHPLSYYLP